MEEINFFLTTDISIGMGLFEKAADFINKQGAKKPGLIFDANLQGENYFDENLNKIKNSIPGCILLANEKNSEPTYAYLEKVKTKLKKNSPDLIVAIGGGSTIDLGKGAALLLTNDVPALSLKGFPENINSPLPLITIPSIFGSGSEVSFNAVFIDEKEGRKLGINTRKNFPTATLIDPLLTMSAPEKAVISSALDSLVHCVDSFGSTKNTAFSRIFSKEGFRRTFDALLYKNLDEPASRIDLAIGSICGITALMNSGDGPTNGFAYYFGVKDKIPHGLAGGIFLKEVMNWNYRNGYNEYSQLYTDDDNISSQGMNKKLFDEIDVLYNKYSIPKLTSYGYNNEHCSDIAKEVSHALKGSFKGNPIPFSVKSAEEILNKLL